MMIDEKSAMTVWWFKETYSLTSSALWRKRTSLWRRIVCWQELHTSGHGIATTDQQRTIKAITDPLFKKQKKKKKNKKLAVWLYYLVRFFLCQRKPTKKKKKKKVKVGRPEPPRPPPCNGLYDYVQCGEMKVQHRCSHVRIQVSDGRQQICFRCPSAGGGHQARNSTIPMFADAKLESTLINENNKKLRYLLSD